MFSGILQGVSRLVYPPHCLLCKNYLTAPWSAPGETRPEPYGSGRPAPLVCPACLQDIPCNRPPFCCKCSRHLGTSAANICKECRRHGPRFDFAWSACLYEDPLKNLVHLLKYGQKTGLRHLLGARMVSFIREYRLDIGQFDLVMPVPLAPTRLRERGYNQARLLAAEIAAAFVIPLDGNHLARVRHTQTQSLLDEKQRWTNIRGAFRIRNLAAVKDKNILLVDDLLTTGATASEAARALKDAGAGTVGVLTLAITAERTNTLNPKHEYRSTKQIQNSNL
ncbi:MAG: ComF family protein [Candidatus Omnitrophica bacterium]|nr:ComF family protein [Candidatus Omnitrophota bacterium]